MGVEVLIPDFNGEDEPLRTVMEARPDILNHNVETVERLQKPVRKRARYGRSLHVLAAARRMADEIGYAVHTKSSLMVGLGETREELSRTFRDLRAVDCDILTIGQYLRPSLQHLELVRYYHPDEFAEMKAEALALGFKHVEVGAARSLAATTPATRSRAPSSSGRVARQPSMPRAASSRSLPRAGQENAQRPARARLNEPVPRPNPSARVEATRRSVAAAGTAAAPRRRGEPRLTGASRPATRLSMVPLAAHQRIASVSVSSAQGSPRSAARMVAPRTILPK